MASYKLKALSHYPVNWVDGMKISKHHFTESNDAWQDHLRDCVAMGLTHFNYGMLSSAGDMNTSLELDIQIDGQNIIQATLKTCRAIAPDGSRIEVLKGHKTNCYSAAQLTASYQHTGKNDTQTYAIIVLADPHIRVPSGEPRTNEQPTRHPFTLPSVQVSILPEEQLMADDGSYLILSKITCQKGEWRKDESYIPPCVAVQNHRKLYEEYITLGNQLGDLGSYCTQIVQKVRAEKTKTNLGNNIQYVCEKLLAFLAEKVVFYRWLNAQRPPVYMIENFVSLAYCIKTSFDCLTEKDREEMFTYFEQWSLLKPAEFENQIQEALKITYDHNDIASCVTQTKSFMAILTQLFGKLSKLKFIGEQHETGIVLGETVEPKKQEKKGGWSFLAD